MNVFPNRKIYGNLLGLLNRTFSCEFTPLRVNRTTKVSFRGVKDNYCNLAEKKLPKSQHKFTLNTVI